MKHLFTITWLDGKGSTTGIKRHLLCWLASLCLALPAMADTFEIGDLRFTVTDETERTVSVKAVNERISGSLVIPDTIEYDGRTYTVTSIAESAFAGCYNLTGVTIPPSVTSIEKGAFKGCTGLTSVTIPSSVTSIGDRAFYGIDTVYYAGNATGSPWRAKKHFKKDRVDITDLLFTVTDETERTVSVKAVNKHISGSLVIPDTIEYDGRTYSVTTIGVRAFGSCHGLTTVTIPPSITSIGENAFEFCSNLTSVTIPSSVTSIGESAFGGIGTVCYAGNATGSPWGAGRHVKFVDGDFGYADEEKTILVAYLGSDIAVTLPSSVTSIRGSAFKGCTGLTSVTIPSSVTSIRYSAFDGIDTVYYAGNATGSPWGAGRLIQNERIRLVWGEGNRWEL